MENEGMNSVLARLFCLVAASMPLGVEAAEFTILNFDGPGEGFNDETVVDEGDGFPPRNDPRRKANGGAV
jgi:hypothetical protein